MLASVYSYRVMVKSVSSCCVRGSRVLSNPVTYVHAYNHCNAQHMYTYIELINLVEKIINYHMAGYEGCNF